MAKAKVEVVIEEYNSEWAREFVKIRDYLSSSPVLMSMRIEHVGSTSVVGLPAKPIIDIDIMVKESEMAESFNAICSLGYRHLGDLGIIGREAFRLEGREEFMRHNLYLCTEDSLAAKNHLNWRDSLRASPDLCTEYATLKRSLAERFAHDVDGYCSGKTEFITNGLSRFLSASEIVKIREQNL